MTFTARPSASVSTAASAKPTQRRERRVARVAEEVLQPRQATCVAVPFADLIDAAENEPRLPPRLCRRHALAHVVGGCGLEVLRQLGLEVGVEPCTPEESAEASEAVEWRRHGKNLTTGNDRDVTEGARRR